MDFSIHAIARKKWRITDTHLYYEKEEIPVAEIKSFELIRPCNGALGEGQIRVWLKTRRACGGTFILYFNYKDRHNAANAIKFMQQLSPENEKPKMPVKSIFRKRCKLCGAVYSYTLSDLERNEQYIKKAQMASLNALTNTIGGTHIGAQLSANQATAASDKVVDYSRCPKCNSLDIADISDEEFNRMQVASARPTAASAADEIKKFKELLDMGVITQEEFDAKKKQLLGL